MMRFLDRGKADAGDVHGVALASAALAPQSARAWGQEGHQVVALIALKHVDPGVQATVNQIFGADPDHLTAPDMPTRRTGRTSSATAIATRPRSGIA